MGKEHPPACGPPSKGGQGLVPCLATWNALFGAPGYLSGPQFALVQKPSSLLSHSTTWPTE